MAVIVETAVIEGNITSCVALWVKLKREALAQQQTSFLQREATISFLIIKGPGVMHFIGHINDVF